MMTIFKLVAGAAIAAALSFAPMAQAASPNPTGNWQTTSGEARFEVSFCGDGAQLCAKLTWLRDDARTAEALPYLGQYVVQGARATAPNRWRGTVNYAGESVSGSLTMSSSDRLKVSGCRLIACQSLDFVRI